MSEIPGTSIAETPADLSGRRRDVQSTSVLWRGGGLLLAITLLAYVPAVGAGFIWDDDDYVTENPTLRSARGLEFIWLRPGSTPQYYPMVFTSFWIEHRLWGLRPTGYHLVNILLHGCNAVLLWRVLRRLDVPGAWLAAAVFAVHPVHVESVAWITERKNVLCGAFALGSLLTYLRYCGLVADAPVTACRSRDYPLSIALFVAALLSKTVVCTLPAVLLLLLWWRRGRLGWTDVWRLLPMFGIGIAMGLTTVWLERGHVGAQGPEWAFSPLDRCLIAGRALWFYAGKLFWPISLTFVYPRWQIDAATAWQYLYPAWALALGVSLWALRRWIGKGPLVAALIFAGTLLPALGFFNVFPMRYSFVADHFQYLGSIALIVLAIAVLAQLPFTGRQTVSTAAGGALIIALGVLTWRQCGIYKGPERLWRDTLAKNPSAWLAWTNLGKLLLGQGQNEESLACYTRAVEVGAHVPDVLDCMGWALTRLNRVGEALPYYRRALEIQPDHSPTLNDLGVALAVQGQNQEALQQFRKARSLTPWNVGIRCNLAAALAQQNQPDQAIAEYTEALAINPHIGPAHLRLADLLQQQGRFDEAIKQYRQAAALSPTDTGPHYRLAAALAARGQREQAIRELEIVLQIDPFNARASQKLRELRSPR